MKILLLSILITASMLAGLTYLKSRAPKYKSIHVICENNGEAITYNNIVAVVAEQDQTEM